MTSTHEQQYFTSLVRELGQRSARATLGFLSPESSPLRSYLAQSFDRPPGLPGSFLADPVFEATFGWKPADRTMDELAAEGLLSSALVDAMDRAESRAFQRTVRPFQHQLAAFRALLEEPRRSVVVSSGTGSGKTECFLVPILSDLARQAAASGPLTGVRALFLYPLNALINSQRERLLAWTQRLGSDVRFCMYNGNTPATVAAAKQREYPQQVLARDQLRDNPPPLLITNATMLEYMLVRREDQPILERSRGMLRWVVLDEAHTYVGSQAAELALLLRRVLHAFGVDSESVQFVATSATIGSANDPTVRERLQGYLANVAGVSRDRVVVITGTREVPALSPAREMADLPATEQLFALDRTRRYEVLAGVPQFRRVRDRLAAGAARLSEISALLGLGDDADARARALAVLDAARHAVHGDRPLLPLRGHLFHRTQGGLWTCCNRACPGRADTPLDHEQWHFGKVFIERRANCDVCEALVFELALCSRCGVEYLAARQRGDSLQPTSVPRIGDDDDGLDEVVENEYDRGDDRADESDDKHEPLRWLGRFSSEHTWQVSFDPFTGRRALGGGVTLSASGADRAPLQCANCGEPQRRQGELLGPFQAGGTFLLGVAIPTLLEFSHAYERSKARPAYGRRTLTFSDSRQGTARFALKAQTEAERNYVRSFIYHLVETKRPAARLVEAELKEIADLEQDLAVPGLPERIRARDAARLEVLRQKSGAIRRGRVAWDDAVTALSTDPTFLEWVAPGWRDRIDESKRLAHFMLFREFARRPVRQNSLETLGLVRVEYRPIRENAQLPSASGRFGLSCDEWSAFLTLCSDYVARGNNAVIFDVGFGRWMGTHFRQRFLLGPEAEAGPEARNVRQWPHSRKGNRFRLVVVLANLLGLDPKKEEGDARDLQALLAAAWEQLHELKVLQREAHGSVLDLKSNVELTTVDDAWICPMTHRVLGTTLRKWGPFTVREDKLCRPITMPRLALPFPQRGDHLGRALPEDAIRRWLETDPQILDARAHGVWTEFSDRIASFVHYYRVAEHSAQQSPARLRAIETEFNDGKLNLLSCSTTMEMGVDIDGLSTVAMNNAPPGPANFLQRAGRAGRRGETAAVSLTMCKSQPHGEAVFRDPLWPFKTPVHVPSVSLQSERIVQRHINALALTYFLATRETDVMRLNMTWFFEPTTHNVSSQHEMFGRWLKTTAYRELSATLGNGLRQLTASSCLAGLEPLQLLLRVDAALDEVAAPWLNELKALRAALDKAGGPPSEKGAATPAQLALERQLRRLRGEYLLKELATRGFIPSHGFPTGLVPFVNTTLEQIHRERKARERRAALRASSELPEDQREDVLQRQAEYPTRPLPAAIREYAPGSPVVIDGLVYTSQGVTLNWHIPANQQASAEMQAFRHAWRCKDCGVTGTSPIRLTACDTCRSTRIRQLPYLQPSGFAVKLAQKPTNFVEDATYVPVRPPWISAGRGPWLDLLRPELGRVRATSKGQLFYRSGGSFGFGYAICLQCGFATSMKPPGGGKHRKEVEEDPSKGDPPKEMREHMHLRGGKQLNGESRCSGNDSEWSIKRGQFLGVAIETNVFELQLYDTATNTLLDHPGAATAIAVALRQALAETLGIEEREIGWAQVQTKGRRNESGRSIILYDTAGGGAGFVSEAPRLLTSLLPRAAAILRCARHCDRACHGCLLTFDTQHAIDDLNRHDGLAVLNESFLAGLDLPPEMRRFAGVDNRFEIEPIDLALSREMQRLGAAELLLRLDGEADEWDIAAWPLRDDLVRWSIAGVHVRLEIKQEILAALDDVQRSLLASLCELDRISVHLAAPCDPPSLVAAMSGAHGQTRWAALDSEPIPPNDTWAGRLRLVSCDQPLPPLPRNPPLPPAQVRRLPPGAWRSFEIGTRFDGPIDHFGQKFWTTMRELAPSLAAQLDRGLPLASFRYEDRYLATPLMIRLLSGLVDGLASFPGVLTDKTRIHIKTAPLNGSPGRPDELGSNWPRMPERRESVLQLLLHPHVLDFPRPVEKKHLLHARQLSLTWQDGRVWTVRLDEGLGFMRERQPQRISFQQSNADLARALKALQIHVGKHSSLPSYLYVGEIAAPI